MKRLAEAFEPRQPIQVREMLFRFTPVQLCSVGLSLFFCIFSPTLNSQCQSLLFNCTRLPASLVPGIVAEQFLNNTATQLTYHGLCELTSTVQEGELCVFFRNNHFSTMIKFKVGATGKHAYTRSISNLNEVRRCHKVGDTQLFYILIHSTFTI